MRIGKSMIAGALACILMAGTASAAKLTVAGTDLTSSAQTFLVNDRTYVPLRMVAQALDPSAEILWRSGTASVRSEQLQLSATVGAYWMEANGRFFYVQDGVRLVNGCVMVPVRVLATAMGGSVSWDEQTRSVNVARGSGAPGAASYSEDDLYWLSRIISAESQGESLEGKLAVGTVVLNRVASSEFPDNIYDVIFDREWGVQFTPIANGTIYNEPTEESVLAARMCLEGVRVAGNSLYFLDPSKSSNFWVMENRDYVTTIGCHWFYA